MNFYPCGDDGPGPPPTRCDFPGCDHAALRKDQCGSKVTSDYCRKHLPSECNAVRAKCLVANLQAENWRELYVQTARDLEATRAAWATCKAIKCCSCLCPPVEVSDG